MERIPDDLRAARSSAGGHLVRLLGTTAGVTSLEDMIGDQDDVDSRVACVVDQFGPTDFIDIAGANHAVLGMPAKLLGGTPADPLVPYSQSKKLDRAYEDVGVECLVLTIPDGGHGGFRIPEVNVRTKQFLDKHLRGVDATLSEEPLPAPPAR